MLAEMCQKELRIACRGCISFFSFSGVSCSGRSMGGERLLLLVEMALMQSVEVSVYIR